MQLDPALLFVGQIIHTRSNTTIGRLIRRARGSWGSHAALVVSPDGRTLAIGDAVFPRCKLTPVEEYNRMLREGVIERLEVYEVVGATPSQEVFAASWWETYVLGTPYDFLAHPRLWLKATFGDWEELDPTTWLKGTRWVCCIMRWVGQAAAGLEWAHWCTEGVMLAYKDAGCDPYKKNNPTPFTTEKRLKQGKLTDVTVDVTVQ